MATQHPVPTLTVQDPSGLTTVWMKTPPTSPGVPSSPTLQLNVRQDRDYAITLAQTKMVYDQLLKDKQRKLGERLLKQKKAHDAKCNELAKVNMDKALEYAVWAQEQLNQLHKQQRKDLFELHRDYQEKLNTMKESLEAPSQKK